MEWQPIETLPDDAVACERKILLRGGGIYHGVEFVGYRRIPKWGWETPGWRTVIGDQKIPDHCIEHWMHRTEPPA